LPSSAEPSWESYAAVRTRNSPPSRSRCIRSRSSIRERICLLIELRSRGVNSAEPFESLAEVVLGWVLVVIRSPSFLIIQSQPSKCMAMPVEHKTHSLCPTNMYGGDNLALCNQRQKVVVNALPRLVKIDGANANGMILVGEVSRKGRIYRGI
jgi:hypothetical protein